MSIMGIALAFFLAFRNNSAYDRWWEARKIWGGIVNVSRTFSGYVSSFLPKSMDKDIEIIVRRHLAWINALRIQLREQNDWGDVKKFLESEDAENLDISRNKATQIINQQIHSITVFKRENNLDPFEHEMLMDCLREMYDLQGKAERIKKTKFPYYYEYFTRFLMWVFIICLPLSLVPISGWHTLPICVITSFIFFILERTGSVTETPLDWNSSGTPMTTLCRVIEIDVLQQIGETSLPENRKIQVTKNGTLFLD
jgi:putative membrane protein